MSGRPQDADPGPPIARCVVCLKRIPPSDERWTVHYRGVALTVCCPSCVAQFRKAPQEYLDAH